MIILALDPSINHLGWAIVITDKILYTGTIESELGPRDSLVVRMHDIIHSLTDAIPQVIIHSCVIEQPQMWGAYKSIASTHSGSLLMLHLLTGALWQWAEEKFSCGGFLVKVSTWKGQLSKKTTEKRLRSKYPETNSPLICNTEHEWDAAGIADWYLTTYTDK